MFHSLLSRRVELITPTMPLSHLKLTQAITDITYLSTFILKSFTRRPIYFYVVYVFICEMYAQDEEMAEDQEINWVEVH